MALGTRDPETPAPATVPGSELVTINRWQARAWEQAITAAYHPDQPPVLDGWNPPGEASWTRRPATTWSWPPRGR